VRKNPPRNCDSTTTPHDSIIQCIDKGEKKIYIPMASSVGAWGRDGAPTTRKAPTKVKRFRCTNSNLIFVDL